MSKLETNTIDTVSGTSTLQVGSTNTTTITLGASGDTINIPSRATIANSGTATGFGGDNTPAFSAYGSTQTLSDSTATKLNFANTYYNVGSAYNTSNSRFTVPSGEDGKYVFHTKYRIENDSGYIQIEFRKNGSEEAESREENGYGTQRYISVSTTWSVGLSAGDYIEAYAAIFVGNTNGITHPIFHGYKLIE